MNSFEIIKGQGGAPKALPNKDHVSGIIFCYETTPSGYGYKVFETKESAIASITDSGYEVAKYHIEEYFRMQPAGRLWVGFAGTNSELGTEIEAMQEYAEGEIRQIAVWNGTKQASDADITALQTSATKLEKMGAPLSILYTAMAAEELTTSRKAGNCNVSVVIGEDLSVGSKAEAIRTAEYEGYKALSAIGACLGCVSLASVNESIAWVSKFNLGFSSVGLISGVGVADKTGLDEKGFLFLVKYDGVAGAFWNDSHTMDIATSDYNTIESVRTIDKACRGVRTYLLPYLASPVYLNDDGTMRADSLANLKNVAGQALEAMERAGELSGYVVEIDAKQNILANSTVEFVIKNVAVGVMRNVKIKIGYTTNIE